MNEQDRARLADNLNALMENWSIPDLEFVIGIITSELMWRRATRDARDAIDRAILDKLIPAPREHNP